MKQNLNRIHSGKLISNVRKNRILIVCCLVVLFTACREPVRTEYAVKGVLDLRESAIPEDSVLKLGGEWAFFWNEFAVEGKLADFDPLDAETFIGVPEYWDPHGRGFGIYSLRILLPEDSPDYLALKLTNVLENYSIYESGRLLYSAGRPAESASAARAESVAAVVPFKRSGDAVNLLIQVSNWNDPRGGLSREIYFGSFQNLRTQRERFLSFDAVILGAVLIIGIYHLAAFFLTISSRFSLTYLFLGFVFLFIALYIGCKDELLLKTLFGGFTSSLRSSFIYSTLILSVPLFFCYIYFVFSELFSRYFFRLVSVLSIGAWLLILFTKRSFYTELLVPFEIFNLSVSVYILVKLIRHFIRGREPVTLAFLAGYIMLVLGVSSAILDNLLLIPPWVPAAVFLLFTFFQTVLQAWTTSDYIRRLNRLNNAFIEMEKETEKLYDLSFQDPLTSLANRRFFNDYMQKLWDRNAITETETGMIMVDIDYFKRYNDRYGHLEGDNCLVEVAKRMKELIHRRGDFIARYGGEEFVAVFQSCSVDDLMKLAGKLCRGVEALGIEHLDSECSESVTVSVGVAWDVPREGSSWLNLFKTADEALYRAKAGGRNRVESLIKIKSEKKT